MNVDGGDQIARSGNALALAIVSLTKLAFVVNDDDAAAIVDGESLQPRELRAYLGHLFLIEVEELPLGVEHDERWTEISDGFLDAAPIVDVGMICAEPQGRHTAVALEHHGAVR